ncbi:hypothetical protein GCM10009554_46660 [Kribbella koreensis]|uniref:AAA family ATPase n=1 Tax=Kribbella koreensis TaxID=57909 RepID=A0ABN1QXC5_9ACTN
MLINSVEIRSFRSIKDSGLLELGPVTVLIGRNNSGKSALLRAIYLVQSGAHFQEEDRRLRERGDVQVRLGLAQPYASPVKAVYRNDGPPPIDLALEVTVPPAGTPAVHATWLQGAARNNISPLPSARPHHLFVPVFARRKPLSSYDSNVDIDKSRSVAVNDHNLTAWIHSLTGDHPESRRFRDLVGQVLGNETSVSTFPTQHGQQPGLAVSQYEGISLDRMGEGISGVLTILAELASPGPRVLLIEEPENDLHPEALRELLRVIIEAVNEHACQVIVSTHSDFVLRTLGSTPGAIIYKSSLSLHPGDGLPTTEYTRLRSAIERRDALADLGYDVTDPVGWLIFEESTAERFFREVLIPFFVPQLAGFRTLAAGGTGKVKKMFEDLRRFMLFVQKVEDSEAEPEPRAWVIVDGDQSGHEAVAELAGKFERWPSDRFVTLSEPTIETYYPDCFQERVKAIEDARAAGADWKSVQEQKGALVVDVCSWFSDTDGAKSEIEASAGELIDQLRIIETRHRELYT